MSPLPGLSRLEPCKHRAGGCCSCVYVGEELVALCLYPHLSVAHSCSVLGKPQHVQVHVVLSASPQAEAESLVVSLQIYRVELSVLMEAGHTNA